MSGHTLLVPENIVGDAGYMQQINIMTPYSQTEISQPHASRFNDAHSATRKCVERTFGMLKNQWQYVDSKVFLVIFIICYLNYSDISVLFQKKLKGQISLL